MRKNSETHQEQENEDALPRSIIAMVTGSVNGLWPFEQTASVGAGALERGDRAVGSRGIGPNQCSTGVGAGTTGTDGVSALARVVSGCDPQKREQAAGTGCDLVFCLLDAVDSTSVGEGEPADGAGAGCHHAGRTLDDFVHQRGAP